MSYYTFNTYDAENEHLRYMCERLQKERDALQYKCNGYKIGEEFLHASLKAQSDIAHKVIKERDEAIQKLRSLEARVGISDIVRWQEAKEYIDFLEAELKETRNHKPTRPEWTKRVEV